MNIPWPLLPSLFGGGVLISAVAGVMKWGHTTTIALDTALWITAGMFVAGSWYATRKKAEGVS